MTDPDSLAARMAASLEDARPVSIVLDVSAVDMEDCGAVGEVISKLIARLRDVYQSMGGDDLDAEWTDDEGGQIIIRLTPKDRPPPDELFRWTWRDRLGAWLERIGRRN